MKSISCLIVIIFLCVGCNTPEEESVPKERASDEETEGLVEFLSALSKHGYDTKFRTSHISEMLGTQRNMTVDGEKVVIFEYDTEEDASSDASNISEGGYSYTRYSDNGSASTTSTSWLITPRYYLYKNMIIRYVGDDEELIETFNDICGQKFN